MKTNSGDIEINFQVSGNADGPVVLMAHSLGCNLHMWDPQLEVLEPDFKIVRLDMRGHGESDIPAGPYSFDELADDVIAVMDQQGIQQAHWVGLSIGGMIGQNLLLRHPHRFLSASLCNTVSEWPNEARKIWDDRIALIEQQGLSAIVDATLQRWFTSGYLSIPDAGWVAIRKQLLATSATGYIGCGHAIKGIDYTDELERVELPVLVLVGAEDMGTPVAASELIHSKIPGSKLVILEGAAHISNVEQADAFNDNLCSFLKSNLFD